VPQALKLCHLDDLDFSPMRTTYFLSRETVIASKLEGMARWREAVCVHVEECQRQPALLQSAAEPGD
jgi:K+ transporter